MVGALFVLRQVTLPYYVFAPGPADDVTTRITVEGHPTYPTDGRLLLTSVTYYRANAYQLLRAWIDPAQTVVPEHDLVPAGSTQDEEFQVALSQMDTSKIDAAVVALTEYADYPEQHGPGVLIEDVLPGGPAEGKLFAGDLVVKADGKALPDVESLRAAIVEAGIGGTLSLTVEAGGKTRTVSLTPRPSRGSTARRWGSPPSRTSRSTWTSQRANRRAVGRPDVDARADRRAHPGRPLGRGRIDRRDRHDRPRRDGRADRRRRGEGGRRRAGRGDDLLRPRPGRDGGREAVADDITVVPVTTYEHAVDYLERAA